MRTCYFALLVASLFLVACSQASKTTDPTGTYTLISIDGHDLPYAPPQEGVNSPQVVSSTLTLNADGTFSMTISFRVGSGNPISRDLSGTYTRDGSDFKMQWKGAGVTTGTFKGNTFTFNNEGALFAYQK
jgi:hypothetical protein